MKCARCRMRHCGCIKRLLRCIGCDRFEDFELVILVHEATYTATKKKVNAYIRVTAGFHTVKTDESSKGIFQQPLSLFVEQGTKEIVFELVQGRKAVATFKKDVAELLSSPQSELTDLICTMKEKSKGVVNPKLKLTFMRDPEDGAEKGLISGLNVSSETDVMLLKQLQKVQGSRDEDDSEDKEPVSELDIFAKGCEGPLQQYMGWGRLSQVYVAILCPPEVKKHTFAIYREKGHFDKRQRPLQEVEVLKIQSVAPDPGRPEVFIIQYLDKDKIKRRLTFERIDRATNVWLEMLQLLIQRVHQQKEGQRVKIHHSKR